MLLRAVKIHRQGPTTSRHKEDEKIVKLLLNPVYTLIFHLSNKKQKREEKANLCIMMPPLACKQLMIVLYYDLQKTETINIRKSGDVAAKRIEFFCQL